MCIVLASVIGIHMASSSFTGVIVTFIPQIVQLLTLGYAMVHIRDSINQLSKGSSGAFASNELRMYTPVLLSFLTLLTGLLANGMTLRARTLELDNDSIGSQERYYNGWTTPVQVWSLHYIMAISFICSVMFGLVKAGTTAELDE